MIKKKKGKMNSQLSKRVISSIREYLTLRDASSEFSLWSDKFAFQLVILKIDKKLFQHKVKRKKELTVIYLHELQPKSF